MQQLMRAHDDAPAAARGAGQTSSPSMDEQSASSSADERPEAPRSDIGPNTRMHRLDDPQSVEIVQEWQAYLAGQRPHGDVPEDHTGLHGTASE